MTEYTDEQIITILRLMARQDIDGLDDLDLSGMTPDQRARVIRRWLEIKARKALQRRIAEGNLSSRRKTGGNDKPADVVQEFLMSPEFMMAIGVFAAALCVTGAVLNAVSYRAVRQSEAPQARILSECLIAKLSGGRREVRNLENLHPHLRAFGNAIRLQEAQEIIDMSDGTRARKISDFKQRGQALERAYERPLGLIGVSLTDAHPSSDFWALPWFEIGLPPLPGGKLEAVPPEPNLAHCSVEQEQGSLGRYGAQ